MPAPSDKMLIKVSFNLFLEDVGQLQQRYGRGWTEQVRLMVNRNCREYLDNRKILDAISGEEDD